MKKAAIFLGAFALIIFMLGALFKIMHWPGAGLLLGWGTLFNLVVVMPVIALFTLSKESANKGLYFYGALSAFILIAGGFFKIQHWPGSAILLTVGTLLMVIFLILFALDLSNK